MRNNNEKKAERESIAYGLLEYSWGCLCFYRNICV